MMDNAKIHHSKEITELAAQFSEFVVLNCILFSSCHIGVCIKYLPPYSPDLNPIEETFSMVKALI
jgi:transposase